MNPKLTWNGPDAPIILWLLMSLLLLRLSSASAQTLEGIAVLPADTFVVGPTSGQFITASNGRIPPFSADLVLRAYHVQPDFEKKSHSTGSGQWAIHLVTSQP